jgi:hypothetical protein
MIYDWNFSERIACTREELDACARLIPRLMNLGLKARRDGLLALEDEIETLGHPFLRTGLSLIVNGTDPELVRKALELQILTQGFRGKELLERTLMLEGMLMIQSGTIPHTMKDLLMVFFSETFLETINACCEEDYEGTTAKILAQFADRPPLSNDTAILEGPLNELSKDDIAKVLHEIDTQALIIALSGASGGVINRMCESLSTRARDLLVEDLTSFLHFPPDIADITAAQEKVLAALGSLKNGSGANKSS